MTDKRAAARDMVVYVASEGMGRGDEVLGAELMSKFLDTLPHFKDQLTHVIFVNAGAKLVVDGSPVLQQLRHLEEVGVETPRLRYLPEPLRHHGQARGGNHVQHGRHYRDTVRRWESGQALTRIGATDNNITTSVSRWIGTADSQTLRAIEFPQGLR